MDRIEGAVVMRLQGSGRVTFGRWSRAVVLATAALTAFVAAAPAAEPGDQLFVVSSFPEALYQRVTQAFERENPGVRVYVLNKKTPAAISYVQERVAQRPDVFWASSPDALEVLKESGDLSPFRPNVPGVPETVGNYPINDPDGFYTGFAVSGYGMMWNTRYLERRGLAPPKSWADLVAPAYHQHIGITAPSRSGTTHVIVEGVLQDLGWNAGWAYLMELAGNLATVTARSFSVVEGVNSGRFGIGLVIDFLGLSSKATGLPVDFAYLPKMPVLPANVAILKAARHPLLAESFIRFLLSETGQRILFEPEMRRLPVVPSAYADAPAGYPNPFTDSLFTQAIVFDSKLSRSRYHLVNALFDSLITFRVRRLNAIWSAIHRAEEGLRRSDNPEVRAAIERARELATRVPVSAAQSADPAFASVFVRKQTGRSVPERQAALEAEWDTAVSRDLHEALEIAETQAAFLEGRAPAGAAQ